MLLPGAERCASLGAERTKLARLEAITMFHDCRSSACGQGHSLRLCQGDGPAGPRSPKALFVEAPSTESFRQVAVVDKKCGVHLTPEQILDCARLQSRGGVTGAELVADDICGRCAGVVVGLKLCVSDFFS
jgi:hypothetical protein